MRDCVPRCVPSVFKQFVSVFHMIFVFLQVSTVKSELDDVKGKTLEEMSEMVQRFHKKIADKKNDLAPIIKVSKYRIYTAKIRN